MATVILYSEDPPQSGIRVRTEPAPKQKIHSRPRRPKAQDEEFDWDEEKKQRRQQKFSKDE